jgi:predicted metal-binding membrane protein
MRDRVVIIGAIAAITIAAWVYLLAEAREMSAMADHDRMMAEMGMVMDMSWQRRDVVLAIVMWAVMMVGMMAPAAVPVFVLFTAAQRARGNTFRWRWVPFATGYFTVWSAFSVAAALLQWALHEQDVMSSAMVMANAGIGGGVLIAAGAYQLTPLKWACLSHCQSPLAFLMGHWRDGAAGAFRMGLRHGAYCLGCCWALMCVLFVVGVMNLLWVAGLSIFVLFEKTGWAGRWLSRVGGVAMIVAGLLMMLSLMPAFAAAQEIEGRWKLVAAEDLRADGSVARYPWGRAPVGAIVVERGWCYVQIMSSDVPSFNGAAAVGEQMRNALLSTYIAYSGACTIDQKEGSVTLKVDAAWRPDYVGTEQKRFFRIEGDRMTFGPARARSALTAGI